jgi:two-component system, cell cycle sensor histidine kinase and response regulator CckA
MSDPEQSPALPPATTVLLVDDEPSVRRIGERALEAAGVRVLSAKDGLEAVQLYREHRQEIGLVVLDLTMPVMSGVETFHALVELNPAVRVLLSSGYHSDDAAQSFGDSAPVGYIQKPYRVGALLDAVRRVLQS